VTITGQRRDLPAVTDLSAFRVIQEALTNTLRHAGPATAAVTVDYQEDKLRVEVTDTGRGLVNSAAEAAYAAFVIEAGFPVPVPIAVSHDTDFPAAGTVGHGLRGMRERAAAAGGTIDIGPLPEGGFRVTASLPLDAQAAAKTTTTTPTEKTEKAAR
jgi:signal transduction histidine kinase